MTSLGSAAACPALAAWRLREIDAASPKLAALARARPDGRLRVVFQGDEDRIVPPNQTELMVEALRRKGVPVGYLLFAGEQHGFRKADNIKRALDAELYFFAALAFRAGLKF